MKQTIAQQLKITEFPFEIKDSKGNWIYFENSRGSWEKREYDSNGNTTYYENMDGFWTRYEYDSKGNCVCLKNSDGFWYKRELDANSKETYFENSDGLIRGASKSSIVEITLEDIAKKFNISVEQLRIKD